MKWRRSMTEPHTDAGNTWERRYGGTIAPPIPSRRSPLAVILSAWAVGIACGLALFFSV